MSRCILNQVVDEAHDGKGIGDAQKMTAPNTNATQKKIV